MRKKVLIMRKTRRIMRKIFGSLRSPKLNYVMFNENNTTVILLAEVDFLMHKQYN